jgi:misacylated tRNA(Ala) deacylase
MRHKSAGPSSVARKHSGRLGEEMTDELFREDAYLRGCDARVVAAGPGWVELDRTVFYPQGGGQPGDTGLHRADGRELAIGDTRHDQSGRLLHTLAPDAAVLEVGEPVALALDWTRRYAHMRMHTSLHLLGSVLRYGVTGGSIGAERSRLDFDMQEGLERERVDRELNALIRADHAVETIWITSEELDARPDLIRTLSVRPPAGAGRIRLLHIPGVDLQPCGGTHVRQTGEIGPVRLGKIEKKGARNRRVYVELV